jgi:hypothetical protein
VALKQLAHKQGSQHDGAPTSLDGPTVCPQQRGSEDSGTAAEAARGACRSGKGGKAVWGSGLWAGTLTQTHLQWSCSTA